MGPHQGEPPRCRACQLQLCKSRDQPPHAGLKVTDGSGLAEKTMGTQGTQFLCETCGSIMIRSTDLTQAGWRHQK